MKKIDWADARLLRRPNCLINRVRVYCRLYDFRRSIRKLRVFCLWHVCERVRVFPLPLRFALVPLGHFTHFPSLSLSFSLVFSRSSSCSSSVLQFFPEILPIPRSYPPSHTTNGQKS